MSDVLLIHPAEKGITFGGMPPLGMGWIVSYLQSKKIPTSLVDFQVTNKEIESILQFHKPKIVGIGGTSHSRFESFDVARRVKSYDSSITTLYGGSHATFTAEDTLKNIPEIDIVVRGEGEITTKKIVERVLHNNFNFSDIFGISYRKSDKIIHNPEAERIKNLDILPFPYRDPNAITRYNLILDFLKVSAASVISSRGCPINCSFCSASAMFGTQLTLRSAKNVVDEIEILLKEYNYQGIKFFDSTLTLNRNHVLAICEEINRRNLKFPWECEIRVNGVTFDLLRTMRNSGCYYVDFGVESASPSILKFMHKGITIEQVENVFRWCKELDIYTKVFFTFGHIGEKIEDAYSTIKFMEKNAKYISIAATGIGVRVYPGTEVERFALSIESLKKDFSWSEPFSDPSIEALGNDPQVPVLIQPQLGWKEFQKIELRLAYFWLKNPIAAITTIWSQIKLGRSNILLKLFRRFIDIYFLSRRI